MNSVSTSIVAAEDSCDSIFFVFGSYVWKNIQIEIAAANDATNISATTIDAVFLPFKRRRLLISSKV